MSISVIGGVVAVFIVVLVIVGHASRRRRGQ